MNIISKNPNLLKNTSQKLALILVYLFLLFSFSNAQEIDEQRMNRDIEVAESVLQELFNAENPKVKVYDYYIYKERKGFYVKGYGLVLRTPRFISKDAYKAKIVEIDWEGQKAKISPQSYGDRLNLDSLNKANKDKIISLMQTFIADYGNLINQLIPEDKILLVHENNREAGLIAVEDIFYVDAKKRKKNMKISAEIQKNTLNEYKSGKIGRDDLIKKIKVHIEEDIDKEENNSEKNLDYDVFAGILEKLLDEKNDKSYYVARDISYNRLKGFGLVYQFKIKPGDEDRFVNLNPVIIRNGNVAIDIGDDTYLLKNNKNKHKNKRNKNEDEEDDVDREDSEKLKEYLNAFIADVRNYMIEYGRLIKNLDSEEILMLDVLIMEDWEEWEENEKRKISFSIKKSVLEAYDKGNISLEEAKEKIEVKKP